MASYNLVDMKATNFCSLRVSSVPFSYKDGVKQSADSTTNPWLNYLLDGSSSSVTSIHSVFPTQKKKSFFGKICHYEDWHFHIKNGHFWQFFVRRFNSWNHWIHLLLHCSIWPLLGLFCTRGQSTWLFWYVFFFFLCCSRQPMKESVSMGQIDTAKGTCNI